LDAKLSRQAEKYLERLDAPTKARIAKGIEALPAGDVAPLAGRVGVYRLRIGDYRIFFRYGLAQGVAIVGRIAPRGDAYKGV
jgi:mRNA interferase RelE/StbE